MTGIDLPALEGTNPLGFLAALGVLDALAQGTEGVTLRWTNDLVPSAVIGGVRDLDTVLDVLDRDREQWVQSPLLGFPEATPTPDAKLGRTELRDWFKFVAAAGSAADHLCAIVAEDAFDGGGGKAKPTHLYFTAGQQKFMDMIRVLAADADRERLQEAVCGPWRYDSPLPSLSWDSRGERVYAVRASDPSKDKRLGVPGADWLAFRGLAFYPVARMESGGLRTTACDVAWKSSAFRWPLWEAPATASVARSLVADSSLVAADAKPSPVSLTARGITSIRQAKIRRSDQGGYGSFSGADTLVTAGLLEPQTRLLIHPGPVHALSRSRARAMRGPLAATRDQFAAAAFEDASITAGIRRLAEFLGAHDRERMPRAGAVVL